jgi:hypothetical protein
MAETFQWGDWLVVAFYFVITICIGLVVSPSRSQAPSSSEDQDPGNEGQDPGNEEYFIAA